MASARTVETCLPTTAKGTSLRMESPRRRKKRRVGAAVWHVRQQALGPRPATESRRRTCRKKDPVVCKETTTRKALRSNHKSRPGLMRAPQQQPQPTQGHQHNQMGRVSLQTEDAGAKRKQSITDASDGGLLRIQQAPGDKKKQDERGQIHHQKTKMNASRLLPNTPISAA